MDIENILVEYIANKRQNDIEFDIAYLKNGRTMEGCISFIREKYSEFEMEGCTLGEILGLASYYFQKEQEKPTTVQLDMFSML